MKFYCENKDRLLVEEQALLQSSVYGSVKKDLASQSQNGSLHLDHKEETVSAFRDELLDAFDEVGLVLTLREVLTE